MASLDMTLPHDTCTYCGGAFACNSDGSSLDLTTHRSSGNARGVACTSGNPYTTDPLGDYSQGYKPNTGATSNGVDTLSAAGTVSKTPATRITGNGPFTMYPAGGVPVGTEKELINESGADQTLNFDPADTYDDRLTTGLTTTVIRNGAVLRMRALTSTKWRKN